MPLLTGNNVYLNAITRDDLAEIKRWYQDVDFMRLYDANPSRPRNIEAITKMFEDDWQHTPNTDYVFAIRPLATDTIIGMVNIDEILWTHRVGWLGIAIGDKNQRGKGYGTEAMRLVLAFAFQELNLRRLQLSVFSYNAPAIHIYEKLGFVHEGTYREFLQRDGQTHDMRLYGILRREWQAT